MRPGERKHWYQRWFAVRYLHSRLLRRGVAQHLRYAYFLRFTVLTWFSLPLLMLADKFTGVSALTRGIMTVDSGWQAFYAAYFVVSLYMTVLVTTRNVILNGRLRFNTAPPPWLHGLMCESKEWQVWTLLTAAQLPAVAALFYLGHTARAEQERFELFGFRSAGNVGFFLCSGAVAAVFFWVMVTLFYYWSYLPSAERPRPSTLIFPVRLFGPLACVAQPRVARWLHWMTKFAAKASYAGYAETNAGPLWELHYLSTLALVGSLVLYVFLCPLTAPVPLNRFAEVCIGLAVLLLLIFLWGLTSGPVKVAAPVHGEPVPRVRGGQDAPVGAERCPHDPAVTERELRRLDRVLKVFFGGLAVGLTGLVVWFLAMDMHSGKVRLEMAFPTLASILVLVTFGLWLLAGASFFFDRYRVPVVTAVLLGIFVPKMCSFVDLEHYYQVQAPKQYSTAPMPADVVNLRVKNPEEPYIIVTAAGGGIQAAEWTSQVMSALEQAFERDPELNPNGRPGYTVHDHLLLASGVSGGSVGLMPYLLEYSAGPQAFPKDERLRARMTNPPACSSLEAVSWGLTYYDLFRALFTMPFPHEGDASDAPDRTWSLTESFNRNLHDTHCHTESRAQMEAAEKAGKPALPAIEDGTQFTLMEGVTRLRDKGSMPAFTFNTTAAETGGRFLLSNYQVPQATDPKSDFLPAESFLQAYAQNTPCRKVDKLADLSLATAARLSATFPYVSSGMRIPLEYAKHAYHFLDGGYYDNDGTASAIEFLMAALGPAKGVNAVPAGSKGNGVANCMPASDSGAPTEGKVPLQASSKELKILLIEIRDGGDLNATSNEDDYVHQDPVPPAKEPAPWKSGSQILGPVEALWNAGHVSVTRRNRLGLCLLESAYEGQLKVHHLVFTIDADRDHTPPLSWHLTAGQRTFIDDWTRGYAEDKGKGTRSPIANDPTQRTIQDSVDWVKTVMHLPLAAGHAVPVDSGACKTS